MHRAQQQKIHRGISDQDAKRLFQNIAVSCGHNGIRHKYLNCRIILLCVHTCTIVWSDHLMGKHNISHKHKIDMVDVEEQVKVTAKKEGKYKTEKNKILGYLVAFKIPFIPYLTCKKECSIRFSLKLGFCLKLQQFFTWLQGGKVGSGYLNADSITEIKFCPFEECSNKMDPRKLPEWKAVIEMLNLLSLWLTQHSAYLFSNIGKVQ